MRYMIHSCNQREWYVDNFLIPSMIAQGISEDDIYKYNDTRKDGNLLAFVKSCKLAYEMTATSSSFKATCQSIP